MVLVSRQLGHAHPGITLQVYSHLFEQADHAATAREALDAGHTAINGTRIASPTIPVGLRNRAFNERGSLGNGLSSEASRFPDARVQQDVDQIHHKIDEEHEDGRKKEYAEQHHVVPREYRVIGQTSEPGPTEDGLHND